MRESLNFIGGPVFCIFELTPAWESLFAIFSQKIQHFYLFQHFLLLDKLSTFRLPIGLSMGNIKHESLSTLLKNKNDTLDEFLKDIKDKFEV